MNGLPGVVNIRSVSNFGLSVVNVYFEDGMDIYFVRQLVGERLQEAREQIPEGFGDPAMGPISTVHDPPDCHRSRGDGRQRDASCGRGWWECRDVSADC